MLNLLDIHDDEIRIIGIDDNKPPKPPKSAWFIAIIIAVVGVCIALIVILFGYNDTESEEVATMFEPETETIATAPIEQSVVLPLGTSDSLTTKSYTELIDTTINDIPLRLFIPHNASAELRIGRLNEQDSSIIYAAQAADVRADNGGIVGAFILNGEPLAWGLSKLGYCASIGDSVKIGVAENTSLFEEATEKGGYFFRQYPLVKDGSIVENALKGKSIRRGICDRHGEIFMVETLSKESFHDFSQALVDLNVDQATYLVGSTAYGWAVDKDNNRHKFGDENIYKRRRYRMSKNTNYIVWVKK